MSVNAVTFPVFRIGRVKNERCFTKTRPDRIQPGNRIFGSLSAFG